jgi:single-strand DNA-binding protein
MANEVMLTVVGRITEDPSIRFVSSGSAVCNFTVAHNSRKFNKQKNEWEDTEATFYRCSLWGHGAENVAETLRKGMSVIVHGAYGSRSWEANGEKKTAQELRVETIGLNLGFVRVDPAHIVRSTGQGQASTAPQAQTDSPAGGSDNDPWAATPAAGEPPF